MFSRPFKAFLRFTPLVLFASLAWTYFQPAIQIQISGIPASHWSAHQLASSFYHKALNSVSSHKQSKVKVDIPASFFDFLEKLFPMKKQQEPGVKTYAGLVLSALIPVAFLLAYLCAAIGGALSFLLAGKRCRFFFAASFFLSGYALAGVIILHEKAGDLVQNSVNAASRGIFGFIAKSFVQQISIQPGVALISFPGLAAALWLLAALRKK